MILEQLRYFMAAACAGTFARCRTGGYYTTQVPLHSHRGRPISSHRLRADSPKARSACAEGPHRLAEEALSSV